MGFFARVLDALFPRSCVICASEGKILCHACKERTILPPWQVLREYEGMVCYARVSYKERAVQCLLHAWKYQGDSAAGAQWESWITEGDLGYIFDERTLIVPVPLAREKYAERGFNQAECLAQALGRRYPDSRVVRLLTRVPRTAQAQTMKSERGNIRVYSPYSLVSDAQEQLARAAPLRIVLVDDVVTTGSTLLACADVLRNEMDVPIIACTLAFGSGS